MKKVLLGLVIAVMMTGNGYADNMISQGTKTCPKLFDQLLVLSAEFEHNVDLKTYLNEKLPQRNAEARRPVLKRIEEYQRIIDDKVKLMHYYAVTWSALCD